MSRLGFPLFSYGNEGYRYIGEVIWWSLSGFAAVLAWCAAGRRLSLLVDRLVRLPFHSPVELPAVRDVLAQRGPHDEVTYTAERSLLSWPTPLAMNFMTGEVAWRDRSVGKGSVTYADGRIYALGENGTVGLIEPSPEGYKEKSRFEINRGAYPTWTPPVIANGRLYLREQDNLYCYNIKR